MEFGKLRKLVREIIQKEILNKIEENLQQAEKIYFNSGKLSQEAKDLILSITNGDYLTKTITDVYWAMLDSSEKKDGDLLDKTDFNSLRFTYEQIKNYNKNVFPIKDFRFDDNDHIIAIVDSLKQRAKILEDLKKLPSIAIRNLKSEIRAERNWREMNDFRHYLEYFLGLYSQLSNRNPELQKNIERKLFKSNTTLKQLIDFAEEKENLLGGFEFNRENLQELIDENSYDMRMVYDKGSIVVVEVTSPNAIKKIGCNSLWCFTYGSGFDNLWRQYQNYSTNDVVYVIVNFSEKPDSKEFMHVLIRPLKKKYDEDDDESTLPLFNMANEVDHDPIWTLKNMFGKVNLNKIFEF